MERKVIIGRIVEDALEYLEDDNGPVEFDSESGAVNWLLQAGYNPDGWKIRHSIGTCFRCGSCLYPSDLPDYISQCFRCDEDFYGFEQVTEPYEEAEV